ncbi:MAG: shikimate dehydrogenase [Parachlamydiales bacterium]|nr:shikimate dehydrogenase [Parachlamydiales bacterium]
MLAAVITGPDLFSAKRQIKNSKDADIIEIRLDFLDSIALDKVKKLQDYADKKIIFSLRRKEHGGKYSQHDKKMFFDLERLFTLEPDYFDLEHDIPLEFIERMTKKHPKVEIIFSYHNFQNTPENLNDIFKMIKNPFAKFYKIATYANSNSDALKMLDFIKENSNENVIGVSIGEYGSFVRIISKIFNNKINYSFVDKMSSPGQISLEEMVNVYNYKNLNEDSKIYALIGDPIDQSLGHVYHNAELRKQNKNAVYVKIKMQGHELPQFFSKLKKLPFKGFSVSMPLKEKVVSFLDEDISKVGSVNTIIVKENKLIGYNTDGIAALDAIERKVKVKDRKVLLIGAGGTAKAIAHEAMKRNANLYIFNRDEPKGFEIASKLRCRSFGLDKLSNIMTDGYDIIINATSCSMHDISVVPKDSLIPGTIVLDIVTKPVDTILLKEANAKGCIVLYGMEMFINQAKKQFANAN